MDSPKMAPKICQSGEGFVAHLTSKGAYFEMYSADVCLQLLVSSEAPATVHTNVFSHLACKYELKSLLII